MSTYASSRPTRTLPVYTSALVWLFAAACAGMAIWVPLFDSANWQLIGSLMMVGAAVLVAAGWFALGRTTRWLAIALVTLGALIGGVFLVWTLVAPVLALIVIVLFARGALRGA